MTVKGYNWEEDELVIFRVQLSIYQRVYPGFATHVTSHHPRVMMKRGPRAVACATCCHELGPDSGRTAGCTPLMGWLKLVAQAQQK
jgi:hypothetical protein